MVFVSITFVPFIFVKKKKKIPNKLFADTDLWVSNLPEKDFVKDDEAIGWMRCIPLNQHGWRLRCQNLVGHSARDVICFFWRYQAQKIQF